MSTEYGRLNDGELEYAPSAITMEDGTVVANPTAETYLAAGWKRIADDPPAPEDGCAVMPSG